jgi:primosomal protein N' (replication factor Y) (superfamily II helicase)
LKKGGRLAARPPLFPSPGAAIVRVLTDVAGIDKEFDYLVPEGQDPPAVGDELRLDLHGRRVGGWVVQAPAEPIPGLALRPYAKRRGYGPEPSLLDLAGWAAWRWAGRRATILRSAAPDFAVPRLPPPALRLPAAPEPGDTGASLAESLPPDRPVILRLPPAADPTTVVAAMARRGPTLVVVPSLTRAEVLAGRIRRAGGQVALLPAEWPQARSGAAVVVGARGAAWAPCPGLAGIVVLDGHDEGLGQENVPTWNAVDVCVERARRASCPCVIVSSCPTPELLALGAIRTVARGAERRGWAAVEVLDRRGDDPRLGLYSERLVRLIRSTPRAVCILNRTGRARLLACAGCGELARCEVCGKAVVQASTEAEAAHRLDCPACGHSRPVVCPACGSTRFKALRIGVSRAREDLEILAGRTVNEITARTIGRPAGDLFVGTEAALHRLSPADDIAAVAFVDFDQEILAPRVRATSEALTLLAHASRLVRGRSGRVVVQTRLPDHPVLRAAVNADPTVLSDPETDLRRALCLPPFAAVAVITGEAAGAVAAGLRDRASPGLQVLGPDGERWLIKAETPRTLADALAGVERPAGLVRVAVDPARF